MEKYLILVNSFPLMLFLFIHFNPSAEKIIHIKESIIKLIAIGFFTSFIGKIFNGWLHPEPVIYSYVKLIHTTYELDYHLTSLFLSIKNHFIYKLMDYTVLLFQALSLYLFFRPAFFKMFSILAVMFHLSILAFLGFSFFYPYILIYCLLLLPYRKLKLRNTYIENAIVYSSISIFFICFWINDFERLYIFRHLNSYIYIYFGSFLMTICTAVFCRIVWLNHRSRMLEKEIKN